ncbi:MAG: hypothetical protein QXE45_02835 [Thermoplasmata archaeon]
MRDKLFALVAVSLILTASISFSLTVCADESEWPIGDEWLYRYVDEFPQENYAGFMRYSCVGKTTWVSRENSIEVVEFRSRTSGNISGDSLGLSFSGNFSINMSEYYEVETGSIVAVVFTQHIRIVEAIDYHRSFWNYSEYNMTEYLPPGGLGYEPVSIDIGTVWHKNYSQYSYSEGTIQGAEFKRHSNYTEHVKYTFLGFETINVPAGSYYSYLLRGDYDDGTMSFVWYSDSVNNFVKIVESYPEGDRLEISMIEHSRSPGVPTGGYAISPWSWVFFIFLGATAVATIAAGIIVSRRKNRARIESYYNVTQQQSNQESQLKR